MNIVIFAAVKPALIVVGVIALLVVFLIGRKIIKSFRGVAKDVIGDTIGEIAGEVVDDE